MNTEDSYGSGAASQPDAGEPDASEAFIAVDWQRRLQAAVEQTIARRVARRAERAEFKRRRDYGLQQRHARKLARNRALGERATKTSISTDRSITMDRDQLAQNTAEYIAANLLPQHAVNTTDYLVKYTGDARPPRDVAEIKEVLLTGDVWLSWLDDHVTDAMRRLHAPAA